MQNFQYVRTTDDVAKFLDAYRGSGIGQILKQQFTEIYTQDEQHAFSALGYFLDVLMEYHQQVSISKEIKDDFMYTEIQDLLTEMCSKPEYNEFKEYLTDKIAAMKTANLLRNQEAG